MGLKAIQPWHYGFCDVSHAQSAAAIASGEKSGAFTLGSRVFIPRYFLLWQYYNFVSDQNSICIGQFKAEKEK